MNKFTKSDQENVIGLLCVATIVGPLIIFAAVVVRAFVIAKLWSWYIVPGFHAPDITLPVAFGVSLLVGYLMPQDHCADERDTSEKIGVAIFIPVFTLLVGWIGTLFM